MENRKYNSRISPILWPITWIAVIVIFYLTIKQVIEQPTFYEISILTLIWLPTLAFILGVMLGVRYIFESNQLTIKIGPFTERNIPIDDILTLERSYNPVSSPANSLKRLMIKYKNGVVLISPAREKDFLRHLKKLNPTIKLLNLKIEDS